MWNVLNLQGLLLNVSFFLMLGVLFHGRVTQGKNSAYRPIKELWLLNLCPYNRPWLMRLTWWEVKWTSSGLHLRISRLTLKGSQRRRLWLLLWRLLVNFFVFFFEHLLFNGLFNLNSFNVLTDVKNKWESSSWGRKLIVQKKRASLNDFDRFKLMLAKIKVYLHSDHL